jgi:hypothetical protein
MNIKECERMAADVGGEVGMSNVNRWVARKYSIDGETVYMVTGGVLDSRDAVIDRLHEQFPDVVVPEKADVRPYRVEGARFVPRAYYIIPMFAGTQVWKRQFESDAESDGPYYAYRTVTGRIPFKHRWHLLAIGIIAGIIGLTGIGVLMFQGIGVLIFQLRFHPLLLGALALAGFCLRLYYARSKTCHLTEIVDEHGVAFNDMYAMSKVNGKEHLNSDHGHVIPSSVPRLSGTVLAKSGEGEPPTIYSDAELSGMFSSGRWASEPLNNFREEDVRVGDFAPDAASVARDLEKLLPSDDCSITETLSMLSPAEIEKLRMALSKMNARIKTQSAG